LNKTKGSFGDFSTGEKEAASHQTSRILRGQNVRFFKAAVLCTRVTGLGEFSRVEGLFTLGSFFVNLPKLLAFFDYFYPQLRLRINFDKKGLGYTLGCFSQTHLVTLLCTPSRAAS
jgi:hypothetical protein